MKNLSQVLKSNQSYLRWYEVEKNTAALIQAIVRTQNKHNLDGELIWNLIRLCWITRARDHDHWKGLKIPALAAIFKTTIDLRDDLKSTLTSASQLPKIIKILAQQRTGFVNFRNVWRHSSKLWCEKNEASIRKIIIETTALGPNDDESRIEIALLIAKLPPVPSPEGNSFCRPEILLTPLVASLDPENKFPVINGRREVVHLLNAIGQNHRELQQQVHGFSNLIGHFGISDAFMIDVLADSAELAKLASKLIAFQREEEKRGNGTRLRYYDDAERESAKKAGTIVYRHLHNRMTNSLGKCFENLKVKQGDQANCRYDALIENYNRLNRDLLIEAKPDPDKGSIRIAIGQLFDYRRFLHRPTEADLAILTISAPSQEYLDLLSNLQITAIWFIDESCIELAGKGIAWDALRA